MVVFKASKLDLLPLSSSSSPIVTSILFHPPSLSLALMHSDSSLSLYPLFPSPFSLPSHSLPPSQTTVPSPTSSATFLHLKNPNFDPNSSYSSRHLFITSSPLSGGFSVLLRFFILLPKTQSFVRARVLCNQKGLHFDDKRFGVVFGVSHGLSVKLVGSINVFAMHSVSNRKIWVFAVKMIDDEEKGITVKLMKCAVVDCCVPVFSVSISFGSLLLGEENGVRVIPLRPLMKGKAKTQRKLACGGCDNGGLEGKRCHGTNGAIQTSELVGTNGCESSANHVNSEACNRVDAERGTNTIHNGQLDEKMKNHSGKVKFRSVKMREDSTDRGAQFVALRKDVGCLEYGQRVKTKKAVSIHCLSPTMFLILDSIGDLHLLCLSNPANGSETPCHMMQLTHSMKVQKLAVLSDTSMRSQILWMSDGHHTVHIMELSNIDTLVDENNRQEPEEKPNQISVEHTIFTSEKIQEIIPMASHTVLILGQGSISAYAIC